MEKQSAYRKTSEIVRRYDFNFRKRFGQNFLTDEGVLQQIVSSSHITENDLVIEIGPGIGTLTRYLCEAACQVAAIEIDRDLVKILHETLSDCKNLRIVEGDVLKVDLRALAAGYGVDSTSVSAASSGISLERTVSADQDPAFPAGGLSPEAAAVSPESGQAFRCRHLKVVANLPYYITTPILMGLFEQHVPAERVTVMVQKEVADRMTARCGSRDYGSLSLAVQYYARPEIVTLVPASSFMPSPKVDSAVVTMQLYKDKPVQAKDEQLLKAIIRAAFGQRRKTLSNALGNAPQIPVTRDQTAKTLTALGLPASARGETLSLQQFAQLADALADLIRA